MYLDHFGLQEAPFRITPHTDFFFAGANRGATLEALLYAITHDEGIVKVTGEVGSGKTMLCRVLIERLPENVETIFLANPSLSRDEILFTLADELRVSLATNRVSAVLRALHEHLIERYGEGRQVVVLIDEAHAMPMETLEEIRLLSNLESNRHKLLQIVLFGQPELNEHLGRNEMRQLRERITHNFTLEPLVHADIAAYIAFRMRAAGYKGPDVFSPAALKAIARASLGLTRRINILADKALLAAFSENTHQITAAHVRAAVRDAEFRNPAFKGLARWALAAAVLLAAGVGLGTLVGREPLAGIPQAAPASPVPPPPIAAPQGGPAAPAAEASRGGQAELAVPAAQPAPAARQRPADIDLERALGKLTRERLGATRDWLARAEDQHWFIQLLASDTSNAAHVEGFLARALKEGDPEAVRVYVANIRGASRLGVIYGDYPTHEAANREMERLAPALRVYGPYLRQVRRLRN